MLNSIIVKRMIEEIEGISRLKTYDSGAYVCNSENIGKRKLVAKWKHGVHDIFKYITIVKLEYRDKYIIVKSIVEECGYRVSYDTYEDAIPYSSIIILSKVKGQGE